MKTKTKDVRRLWAGPTTSRRAVLRGLPGGRWGAPLLSAKVVAADQVIVTEALTRAGWFYEAHTNPAFDLIAKVGPYDRISEASDAMNAALRRRGFEVR